MSILVLGGAGYIGSHTALELTRIGLDVVVADSLVTGHIGAVPEKARFYNGDIRDREFLDDLFKREKVDTVIHFAAFSQVGESVTDPLKYYDNNLCGTKTLLEAMVRNGVDKIVFSSTAAVYGEPDRIPIPEDAPTVPTNPYGETKLAMEKMFKWTAGAHGLRLYHSDILMPAARMRQAPSERTMLRRATLYRLYCRCKREEGEHIDIRYRLRYP